MPRPNPSNHPTSPAIRTQHNQLQHQPSISIAGTSNAATVGAGCLLLLLLALPAAVGVDCLDDAIAVKSFLMQFSAFCHDADRDVSRQSNGGWTTKTSAKLSSLFCLLIAFVPPSLSLSLSLSLFNLGLIAALLQGKKYLLSLNDFEQRDKANRSHYKDY